ncbi:hypothetical protein CDD82_4243 [Ophiocordyceps australis]|uniref:SURP motif domain-containing protein n=1 Tax=Ophiocordyceps australis TaxID=1399860 RepID=A0A2C5Z8X0_9HYPO|nr:hypothetical protein CDD82_4243 [Ophiocordyceps australis]
MEAGPEVPSAEAMAELDGLKVPPNMILPPRDLRNVLERTAGYVARNGPAFQERIQDNNKHNLLFSFLLPDDAYFPYYEWRVGEIAAGRGTSVSAGRVRVVQDVKDQGPPPPPDFQFSAKMPRINQKDLDVLKMTAQFTAKHGRQWMTHLAQREAGNPQFQFLIPNHTFHNFFQHIVEQYSKIIKFHENPQMHQEMMQRAKANIDNPYQILERARQRAEYGVFQEREKHSKEEEEAKKRAEIARIDWGDFVIVETITFTDSDETANLPPPTNLSELQYASLEDRKKISISANLRIEETRPDEDLSMLETGYATYPAASAASQSPFAAPARPGSAPQSAAPQPFYHAGAMPSAQYPAAGYAHQPQRPSQEEEEALHVQERPDAQSRMQQSQADGRGGAAPIKIRENYVPRAAQRAANKPGSQMGLCPNCKQQIPLNELEAHMRIELLDPSWKEQKAKADARYAHSNMSTADVANNLKRLASQRSDVFDAVSGQPISEDELARRKKAAMNSFDGNPDGKNPAHLGHMQSFNVEEQIKAIHQKFSDKKETDT